MAPVVRKESKIMARFKSLALLLTAGAATGACVPAHHNVAPPNMGLIPVNQPVVQRTDYVLDIASSGGVAPAELRRLDAWFESLQLGYGDRISIDAPYLDEASRRDIASVAASYGMLVSDGAPITAGNLAPGAARVVVSRTTASMPTCPNWDRGRYNASTETSSNFGCANNGNLAAMIANPEDLVLGQSGNGVADPAATAKSIKQFRDNGNKPLQAESAGSR